MNFKKLVILIIIIVFICIVGAYAYISANSHNTNIEVISNSTLKNGDFITIVLKDNYRNVYPNQNIDVKLLDDSGQSNKYVVTTDNEGEASIELMGFENGNYTVHCEYNGTLFLSKSKIVSNLEIDDGYNY